MPQETQQLMNDILAPLFAALQLPFQIEYIDEGHQWRLNIQVDSEKEAILIGNGHEVLDSLQHFTRVALHKKLPTDFTHFILDVNNIRSRREHVITSVIPQIAKKDVQNEGHTIILVGLSGYERRLIHQDLVEVSSLETTSVGPRFNRKLIIRPTTDTGSRGIDNAKIYEIEKLIAQVGQL